MTKIIKRKLLAWTIAYYNPDYDEIHIDEKFVKTPLYKKILAHEVIHSAYRKEPLKSFWFDIIEALRLKTDAITFEAMKYKPLVIFNVFFFITFPIDYVEFLIWKKFSKNKAG